MTDTRESLAKELAEERFAADVESCQQGGCKIDFTVDDYYAEALQFVNRCILVGMETY